MKRAIVLMVFSLLLLVGCSGLSDAPSVDAPADTGDAMDSGSDAIAPMTASSEDDSGVFGTFRDVMSWGRSAHCTWDMRMETGSSSGEMWIDGELFKQDITTEGNIVHSIGDGEYMYMWGSDVPSIKIPMNLREIAKEAADTPPTGPSGPDMDIEYNYDCEPMSIPSSMFVPPSGIEFQDIGEMMAGLGR